MASRKLERQIDQSAEREGKAISRMRELANRGCILGRFRGGFLHGRTIRDRGLHSGNPPGRGAHPADAWLVPCLLAF